MIGRHGKPWLPATRPCFFRDQDQRGQGRAESSADNAPDEGDGLLLCRQCLEPITSKGDRLQIQGKHCHVFPNPEGIVFELGCFGRAPGCLRHGQATAQYSWFPPHAWSFALCRCCSSHVGWFYEVLGKSSFYGLILDRLVEE